MVKSSPGFDLSTAQPFDHNRGLALKVIYEL